MSDINIKGETLINLEMIWPDEGFYPNDDPDFEIKRFGMSDVRDSFLHNLEAASFGRCLSRENDPPLPLRPGDISRIAQPASLPKSAREFQEAGSFDSFDGDISYADLFFGALQKNYAGIGLENYIMPVKWGQYWTFYHRAYGADTHIKIKDDFIEKAADLLSRQDRDKLKEMADMDQWYPNAGAGYLVVKALTNGEFSKDDLKRVISYPSSER